MPQIEIEIEIEFVYRIVMKSCNHL